MMSSLWDEISANSIKLHGQHLSRRRIRLKVRTSRTGTFFPPLRSKSLRSSPAGSPWKSEPQVVRGEAAVSGRQRPVSQSVRPVCTWISVRRVTHNGSLRHWSCPKVHQVIALRAKLHFVKHRAPFLLSRDSVLCSPRSAQLSSATREILLQAPHHTHTARPGSHNTLLETPLQWEPSFPVPLSE